MVSDKATGLILFIIGLGGMLLYGLLLFFIDAGITTLILQLSAFLAVAMILAIIAWIGYIMATTPPPEHLDVSEVSETETSEEPETTKE